MLQQHMVPFRKYLFLFWASRPCQCARDPDVAVGCCRKSLSMSSRARSRRAFKSRRLPNGADYGRTLGIHGKQWLNSDRSRGPDNLVAGRGAMLVKDGNVRIEFNYYLPSQR